MSSRFAWFSAWLGWVTRMSVVLLVHLLHHGRRWTWSASPASTMPVRNADADLDSEMKRRLRLVSWDPGVWAIAIDHPAILLTLVTRDQIDRLPQSGAVYIHLDLCLQSAYVGETRCLPSRVRASIKRSLATATHILAITPTGTTWDDDFRLALQHQLIQFLRHPTNRIADSAGAGDPVHVAAIVADVEVMLQMLLPVGYGTSRKLTQGEAARELVLSEHRYPFTRDELRARLRSLGWPMSGATWWKTLSRDLVSQERGVGDISIDGSWSAGDSLIYVKGRRYSSGWQPTR